MSDLSLRAFAEELSATSATPGGGSAVAISGALGAGLTSMAFRLAAKEETTKIPEYLLGRAEELDDLRDCLLELVDRDAEAFQKLLASGEASEEKRERARTEALEAPLETAEFSLASLRLWCAGRPEVPHRLSCDFAVALGLLEASLEGALAVAEQNLADWPAGETVDEYRATIATLRAELRERVAEVRS